MLQKVDPKTQTQGQVLALGENAVNAIGRGSKTAQNLNQLARLDVATKALMPAVAKGDSAAIDIYLKVAKREASLLGLDAPTNSTVEANHIVTVHAPWMSPSRLAYLDNVTEATSVETIRIPS